MKGYVLYLLVSLSLMVALPIRAGAASTERRITMSEYLDKVQAAWIGKMAGVGWGITTEFRYSHRIVPDSLMQPWTFEMVNEGFNQDDLYLSLLSLEVIDRYGADVTASQACIDRLNLQFEYGGRNALASSEGIAPPDLGHPHYKPTSDGCGYTCGADFSGIIAPGLPTAPVHFTTTFGTDRCYGDGLYGGTFVGAMYCEAFFTQDPNRIIEIALLSIPEESLLAQAVRDVVKWHRLYPLTWKKTWGLVMDKYWWNTENNWIAWPYGGVAKGNNLDSKSMAAFSVMALLYGEGDLYRTMEIAVQGSEDSDCNASIAAGVLLASKGMKAVDSQLLSALNRERRFKYFARTFDGLTDLTQSVAKRVIPYFGGRIERENGVEYIVVPATGSDLRHTEYISSKNPAPLVASRFTPEQMNQFELLSDPGFENDGSEWSFFSDLNNNHIVPVERVGEVEGVAENRARTGFCNALLSSWFKNGYPRANTGIFSGVRQSVRVTPESEYRLFCHVQTAGDNFAGKGVLRVKNLAGEQIASVEFGNKLDWTKVGLVFNSGTAEYLIIEIGFKGENNHRMSLRIDDCSLKIKTGSKPKEINLETDE